MHVCVKLINVLLLFVCMIEHTLTFDFIFIFKSDLNIEHAKITVGFINTLGLNTTTYEYNGTDRRTVIFLRIRRTRPRKTESKTEYDVIRPLKNDSEMTERINNTMCA